jgi:hypothetical protein
VSGVVLLAGGLQMGALVHRHVEVVDDDNGVDCVRQIMVEVDADSNSGGTMAGWIDETCLCLH